MKTKILVVEDDKSLGPTLVERLASEGYKAVLSPTLKSARKELLEFSPDLIILDVGLPDGEGFDFAREISRSEQHPPFLFLTAMAGAPERLKGFELGAEEFIPKPFHLKELLIRIKHVLNIHKRESVNELIQVFIFNEQHISFSSFEIKNEKGEIQSLVPRDAYLLQYLVTNRERVVSRDEILDKLWGEDQFPTNRTIDNSIVRLRQALGDNKCIQSVRGIGYRWIGEISLPQKN